MQTEKELIEELREKHKNKKEKIILHRDKHIIFIYNPDLDKTLIYDLKEGCMKKESGKDWIPIKTQYPFFSGYCMGSIECEEEKFMKLIKKTQKLNPLCHSLSSFISRMNDSLVYENYCNEGIETECYVNSSNNNYYKRILNKPLEFYSKNAIRFFKEHKVFVNVALEKLFIEDYALMDKLICILPHCNLEKEEAKDFLEDLNSDCFFTLVEEYKYDIKSLVEYLFNYLKPFENLEHKEAIQLLRDYYRMANAIGRNVKKYPKYLKSMHDILTSNFNAYKKEYDEILFEKLKKPELEFKDKVFCIIVPKNSKEIISEGTSLNQCVGSYVDKILREETYIFFLRKTETSEESLITLELKNNKIVQAKGSYNRPLNEEERKFLGKYS